MCVLVVYELSGVSQNHFQNSVEELCLLSGPTGLENLSDGESQLVYRSTGVQSYLSVRQG